MIELNAFGETCPKPVIRAMKALADPVAEGTVRVLVDNQVAVENLKRLGLSKQAAMTVEEVPGGWAVTLSGVSAPDAADQKAALDAPKAVAETPQDTEARPGVAADGDTKVDSTTTVLIGSNVLGRGNDELGGVLMRGVIYALAEGAEVPRRLICYNSGAYLTSEGAPTLDDIRALERRGTEVLTCGTCLDYLGIRDKLAVGGVTNLYAIAQALMGPGRAVTL